MELHDDVDLCDNCVYGKQKRFRFLKVWKEKKREKLDLVNIDLWGTS